MAIIRHRAGELYPNPALRAQNRLDLTGHVQIAEDVGDVVTAMAGL